MLTLFHSPHSRSTAILALIEEMGIRDRIDIREVTIPRMDGSGVRDPANPHPEGKVPALVHNGQVITERGAIIHIAKTPQSGVPTLGARPVSGKRLVRCRICLLYTSPSPRDRTRSRMPSSA